MVWTCELTSPGLTSGSSWAMPAMPKHDMRQYAETPSRAPSSSTAAAVPEADLDNIMAKGSGVGEGEERNGAVDVGRWEASREGLHTEQDVGC
jgi:hypothetical protein